MWTDSLGNPVSLQHESSLAGVDDFVEGFIASEARAVNILQAAAVDQAPLVQAYAAALHMFAETGAASANARPFIDGALSSPLKATAREQGLVRAIEAWVAGDVAQCIALLDQQVRDFPRDLVALKLAHYHLFNVGN